MSEEKNTLTVPMLARQFERIANAPAEQFKHYLSDGKKVVGCVPVYTPEELIHSMGLVPFGVWGGDGAIEGAKRYFPAFICGIAQTVLDLGIRGCYEEMSALVIPSLCDSLKALGQNWKYAVKDIPFIPMTYPQHRTIEPGRKFLRATYGRVIRDLEAATGEKFDDRALQASLNIYTQHNGLMREFDELASRHDEVTPSIRRHVFKSAWFMLKEEHSALLEQMNKALRALPEKTDDLRIVTTGILADNLDLLALFEQNGLTICGDDLAHESRQYRVDAENGEDPLEKLVDKFARMGDCSVLYDRNKHRVNLVRDLAVRREADGVVFVMTKFCDPEEFDYVPIKRALDEAGIPNLTIEIDRQMERFDQAQTAIETFKDLLH